MSRRRELARHLEGVAGFSDPDIDREQYVTSPEVAAHLIHEAALRSDLDQPVVDLGTGTGMLAIGAAMYGADRVIGVDIDAEALADAAENARALGADIELILGDVTALGLCPPEPVTVIMNPPFGAQRDAHTGDRAFLSTAASMASVSYSIHNAGSRSFVEAFVADAGGEITMAAAATLDVDHQYAHHTEATAELDVEVYRIEWPQPS